MFFNRKRSKKKIIKLYDNTLTLSSRIELDKVVIMYNEPIFAHFHLENHSSERAVTFLEGGDNRNEIGRSINYIFRLRPEESEEIVDDPYPDIFRRNFGGFAFTHNLLPRTEENIESKKNTFTKKLFLIHYVKLTLPGKYYLSIKRNFNFDDEYPSIEVTTNEIPLTILPYDEEETVSYIQNLIKKLDCEKIESDAYNEVLKIIQCFSPHPFLLPFFINLSKQIRSPIDGRMWYVMKALEQYQDEIAITEGILNFLHFKFEDVRLRCTTDELANDSIIRQEHSVCASIARSKSIYAEDHLAKFQKSDYHPVRNTLANRLNKSKRFICYLVFEEYIDDASDWIRKVSKKYLDEHPIPKWKKKMLKMSKTKAWTNVVVVCNIF